MMRSKVKDARDRIEALRLALISPTPEEIGAVLPGLEEAVHCLETVEREVREGACAPYEVRRELRLLKNELRISARLVEHGVAFCQGWAKALGAGPEYAQNGHTVQGQSEGTFSVRG